MSILAILTILVGALETAGGMQELVYQGILNSRLYPLIGGTIGTVAGAFLLATGIALFRRSPNTRRLARATVAVSLPVFLLIGVIAPLAGLAATILACGMPLVVLAALSRQSRHTRPLIPPRRAA